VVERALLYVERTPGMAKTAAWTLNLARALSCRVFAVSVLGGSTIPHRVPSEPARRARDASASDTEERAWELLYEIEDDAFGQDVRISLLLEQGDPLQRILNLSANYDIELIIASGDTRLPVAELVRQTTRPVLFVK